MAKKQNVVKKKRKLATTHSTKQKLESMKSTGTGTNLTKTVDVKYASVGIAIKNLHVDEKNGDCLQFQAINVFYIQANID